MTIYCIYIYICIYHTACTNVRKDNLMVFFKRYQNIPETRFVIYIYLFVGIYMYIHMQYIFIMYIS